jgi:hypothetical protein
MAHGQVMAFFAEWTDDWWPDNDVPDGLDVAQPPL